AFARRSVYVSRSLQNWRWDELLALMQRARNVNGRCVFFTGRTFVHRFRGTTLCVILLPGTVLGQGMIAPSPLELKKADALIAELYGDEIAKAGKDAKALARLAGELAR